MRRLLSFLSALALASSAFADQTTVNWLNTTAGRLYSDLANTILLSAGTGANGDGFVLQLGYYNLATTANNFLGTWVPLTGAGSANTAFNTTSFGDNGFADGRFSFATTFVQGDGTSGNNLPSSTTIPLAIRFYDSNTVAGASSYGAVSDDAWLWQTPSFPGGTINISIDPGTSGLEWLGGGAGYHTNQTIPEPSSVALLAIIAAGAAARRRYSF
jgi:hypothetical protein